MIGLPLWRYLPFCCCLDTAGGSMGLDDRTKGRTFTFATFGVAFPTTAHLPRPFRCRLRLFATDFLPFSTPSLLPAWIATSLHCSTGLLRFLRYHYATYGYYLVMAYYSSGGSLLRFWTAGLVCVCMDLDGYITRLRRCARRSSSYRVTRFRLFFAAVHLPFSLLRRLFFSTAATFAFPFYLHSVLPGCLFITLRCSCGFGSLYALRTVAVVTFFRYYTVLDGYYRLQTPVNVSPAFQLRLYRSAAASRLVLRHDAFYTHVTLQPVTGCRGAVRARCAALPLTQRDCWQTFRFHSAHCLRCPLVPCLGCRLHCSWLPRAASPRSRFVTVLLHLLDTTTRFIVEPYKRLLHTTMPLRITCSVHLLHYCLLYLCYG
jgi:hypothetical protein